MIVGKDVPLIEQILRVLTYFIRCSELAKNTEAGPLLTVDIDDTATLTSASDVTFPVDVTSSPGGSVSASVTSVSPVGEEKPDSSTSDSCSGSAFVLKPVPSSSVRVHFENGSDDASLCSVNTSKSTDHTVSNTAVASDGSELSISTLTMEDQSMLLETDPAFVSEAPLPLMCFRADVSHALPPFLAETCSECNVSQPCKECSENMMWCSRSKDAGENDDYIPLCNVSDSPPSEPCNGTELALDRGENLPSASDSPKPCQLSPMEVNENVCRERIAYVRREPVGDPRPNLYRVPLEKPAVSYGSTRFPVLATPEHSCDKPQYRRGNSMFDEYFDGNPPIELCPAVDDSSAFDDIMNEPCPDVTHINVSQISSGSSLSEVVPDLELDTKVSHLLSDETVCDSATKRTLSSSSPAASVGVFDERHFGAACAPPSGTSIHLPSGPGLPKMVPGTVPLSTPAMFSSIYAERHFAATPDAEGQLNDIPDGPSKQMISSAIKLMKDVCSDCTSQTSVDDLADVPASDYFTQSGLAPSWPRQRHVSGQSNSSVVRCR